MKIFTHLFTIKDHVVLIPPHPNPKKGSNHSITQHMYITCKNV